MLTLYDNPFSPFARKVRMVLDRKGLAFESVDALALEHLDELRALNPRGEVPVLVDGEIVVVDSADIVAYIEDLQLEPALLPRRPDQRVRARRWHRIADRTLDAIIHDISLWSWPTHDRSDAAPAGLLKAGRRDLLSILSQLELELGDRGFVCGELSIADLALFPHCSSLRLIGVPIDSGLHPRVARWYREMRTLDVVRRDLGRIKKGIAEKFGAGASPYESEKVVWRGDRIEWLLGAGFDHWWARERASGRAVVPSSTGRST